MKYIIAICFLFFIINLCAQNKSNVKRTSLLTFHSIVQAGLLEGEEKNAFQAQAINGMQYRTWYSGIGIGVDNYKFRTIPLFIDIQKNILKKSTTPFVFTDAGVHFPWLRNDQKDVYRDSHFSNGFYFNAGAGYRINLLKSNWLTFSTAFSLKALKSNYTYTICPFIGPCYEQVEQMKYTLRRLSLSVGWCF